MERPTATMLRIGDWCVNPTAGEISRNGETVRIEVRTMRLLLCLAERAGQVVSIDDLLTQVWSEVTVSPDSVYQAVASLRRVLGDDPKQPNYIATVPRLGYRMVAAVIPWPDRDFSERIGSDHPASDRSSLNGSILDRSLEAKSQTRTSADAQTASKSRYSRIAGGALFLLGTVLAITYLLSGKLANSNHSGSSAIAAQKSIAVLPFLDLTDKMSEEPFADGMTEELIDKLSKVPGLRVPPPTSSFYFKGKLWPRSHGTTQATIADIAKTLAVAYVLDGSVRKSHGRVRVDARLIRADNGYVVWSETYDRPLNDILIVQDDIAGEVTKALSASIK